MTTARKTLYGALLIAMPLALVLCAVFRIKASALLTLVVGIMSIILFFLGWERSKPAIEQIVPVVALGALAACTRIIFAALPNVQALTAFCVIAGCTLGPRQAFMVGALAAFVSNCFLGQGPWTPWQMYSWGLVGFLAGILFYERISSSEPRRTLVCIYGFLASFLYGAILDTWMLVGFTRTITIQTAVAVYGAGFAFNVVHAISTLAFLLVFYVPFAKKMIRYRNRLSSQVVANENSLVMQ